MIIYCSNQLDSYVLGLQATITNDIQVFTKWQSSEIKIALIDHMEVDKNYLQLIDHCYITIIFSDHGWELLDELKNKNVYIAAPIKLRNSDKDKVFFCNYWINRIVVLYKQNLNGMLQDLSPGTEKKFSFDALLGYKTISRDYQNNLLIKHNLLNAETCSYGRKNYTAKFVNDFDNCNWIQEPGVEYINNNYYYRGVNLNSSITDLIPLSVYNKSLFSIVATADADKQYSVFCEKIAKPIIARRLFIVFANAGYLQHLRDIGFKTFDGIIDESYDSIENNIERWDQAFEQVKLLSQKKHIDIIEQIKPIVDHNFAHIMNTDWDHLLCNEIQNFINNVTAKI